MAEVRVWEEYYQHASLEPSEVREGCEPRIIVDDRNLDRAIVLLHGLTDSPYFMEAIGKRFHKMMGCNVFIPLLTGHGLKDPQGMKNVTLHKWIEDINFAIGKAQERGKRVSIGGLSNGGALSVYKAITSPSEITGGVFLFAAALDIGSIAGNAIENLLRTKILLPMLADIQDRLEPELIGDNPYRYCRMDNDGARQLSKSIEEIDKAIASAKKNNARVLTQPVFAAHSEGYCCRYSGS